MSDLEKFRKAMELLNSVSKRIVSDEELAIILSKECDTHAAIFIAGNWGDDSVDVFFDKDGKLIKAF